MIIKSTLTIALLAASIVSQASGQNFGFAQANTTPAQGGFLQVAAPADTTAPKLLNIVNFIRLLEPRDSAITEDVLYQTVVRQVALMRQYHLGGTFLLQYDALMDPRYQKLLKSLPKDSFEIGGWWEFPQPLVERAGLKWRGRYPWDWRADVGFVTGYTPGEREMLADAYMQDFKKIFGYYPKSVGSWFIDAHSLEYLYKKYKIVASCNCKDQYGTDGYTLWGGYWNQAYYPSKLNSYMPAQHSENQVPVPIFRMLGSDPIRQYDDGLGSARQGVITLEPVYPKAGGDPTWVNWFLKSFVQDPSVGFNYTQAGQENSFTWDVMAKGLEIQMPLIAKLRDEKKIRVETLEASGRWFREKYKVTPTTSFSVDKDIEGSDKKTVWFDSRFYRINLLWENNTLRVRDIHLFDEQFPSVYETRAATTNDCQFFTLPFVDGYLWSKANQIAGLRVKARVDGKEIAITGGQPIISRKGEDVLQVSWPLAAVSGTLEITLSEKQTEFKLVSSAPVDWFLELNTADSISLPFKAIHPKAVECSFESKAYSVTAVKGAFVSNSDPAGTKLSPLRITPQSNTITLSF